MNKKHPFSLLIVLLLIANGLCAQTITIGSYNIRYANKTDTGNLWQDRAPVIISLVRFHDFDVFGTQEGLRNQVDDLSAGLPNYNRYGVGRDDGKDAGEHSAIYFKKDKFNLLDKGDFWLSQTPDKPSFGWDAQSHKRVCSWVLLEDKVSKHNFYFFNVHYDHRGVIARRESSHLILKKIKEIAKGLPTILTGDFNGANDTEWYKTLAQSELVFDTQLQVQYPYKNNASFNAFGSTKALASDQIIDHIFVTKDIRAKKWGILTDTYRGKFPSDHFPILTVLEFKNK